MKTTTRQMTEDELIDIWRYFQYCCVPSVMMARYAFMDSMDGIRAEKSYYRHMTKKRINDIYNSMMRLPDHLMSVSHQNITYMNIFSDNVGEVLEDDLDELRTGISLTLKNGKIGHIECLAGLNYISALLQVASARYTGCCEDIKRQWHKDVTEMFRVFDLHGMAKRWSVIVDDAIRFFGYDKADRKHPNVDFDNPRCNKAIEGIMGKLTSIDTLQYAMEKSYPWSVSYREDIPYEESADYIIVHTHDTDSRKTA